jgi:hypothetical protein
MAYKTTFTPKNPNKYIGYKNSIKCRSLWERRVCKFFDESEKIKKWSFEEIEIPYVHPVDKQVHRYIPDFLIQVEQNNINKSIIVEVKPLKHVHLKESASSKDKLIFEINKAKWNAAEKFCQKHQMQFQILTEKDIFCG